MTPFEICPEEHVRSYRENLRLQLITLYGVIIGLNKICIRMFLSLAIQTKMSSIAITAFSLGYSQVGKAAGFEPAILGSSPSTPAIIVPNP